MRVVSLVVIAVAVVVLGAWQVLGSVALRSAATVPSWPAAVSARGAAAVAGVGDRVPVPWALRLVRARAAIVAGDLAAAGREIAVMPASDDRLALVGDLAEARGDSRGAAAAFLAAGDVAGLEREAARLHAAGDDEGAVRLQRAVVERLAGDATQRDAYAAAAFALGRAEETAAYRYAVGSAARNGHEIAAAGAYARAVAVAPLEERYLLGLGSQQLNIDRLDDAVATFRRALVLDPRGVEAWAGLGEAAVRRGDRGAALDDLRRGQALDARDDAVRRLAAELGT